MAEGLNRVTLIGNLGQEPELRSGKSGEAILKLRLATSERFVDRNGERQERTEWHSVVLFGKRASGLGGILSKGHSLCVEGRIQTRSWETDSGTRYATEIVATNVVLLGGPRPGGSREPSGPSGLDIDDDHNPF